jgi:hypothetical protein
MAERRRSPPSHDHSIALSVPAFGAAVSACVSPRVVVSVLVAIAAYLSTWWFKEGCMIHERRHLGMRP